MKWNISRDIICIVDVFDSERRKNGVQLIFILLGSKFLKFPTELVYSKNEKLLLVSKLHQHVLSLGFFLPCENLLYKPHSR